MSTTVLTSEAETRFEPLAFLDLHYASGLVSPIYLEQLPKRGNSAPLYGRGN